MPENTMEQLNSLEREMVDNGWRRYERLILAEVKRGIEERAKMQNDLRLRMDKMENKMERALERSEEKHRSAGRALEKEVKELNIALTAFVLKQQAETSSIKTHPLGNTRPGFGKAVRSSITHRE
jgi:hypothetical protein